MMWMRQLRIRYAVEWSDEEKKLSFHTLIFHIKQIHRAHLMGGWRPVAVGDLLIYVEQSSSDDVVCAEMPRTENRKDDILMIRDRTTNSKNLRQL